MVSFCCLSHGFAQEIQGYFLHPDVYENTVVFVTEGDLWIVSLSGGEAIRLTTHGGRKAHLKFPRMENGSLMQLVDEFTASDGEPFAEGFPRLGMGQAIGARTWGGEAWLSGVNKLRSMKTLTSAKYGKSSN